MTETAAKAQRVRVELADAGYDVRIESGALARAGATIARLDGAARLFVVTDANVARHHLEPLLQSLAEAGRTHDKLILPAGETTKSWAQLEALTDWLIARGAERGDLLLALGGGVIGDLAGFAAAILKRGCGFIQVPTTLLAQVDSSVGGKTAINTRGGKNLIGAFHQPRLVIIDPDVLATLPPRDLRAGYAEVVKYGLIDNPDFFGWCEKNGAALLTGDLDAQSHAIATSVAAKAAIVAADERETTGTRALLNLGHTFGHALEAETGYSDALVHGEAVAAGMALAFGYSVRRGECSPGDADRVRGHLRAVGLPDGLAAAGVRASGAALTAHMANDKKASGGNVPFLLTRGIGKTFLARDVDLTDVAAFLDGAD